MTYGLRIEAPRFVARVEVAEGRVVMAAPIVRRQLLGRTVAEVYRLAERNGWRVEPMRP